MADGDGSTPPEGGGNGNNQQNGQQGQQGTQGGNGGDAGGNASGSQNGNGMGNQTVEPTWEQFLESLGSDEAERVRGHVKGKTEKLDGDLRRVREEKRGLQKTIDELRPKAEQHDQAQQAQQSAEDQAAQRERAATERAEAAVARMVRSEVKALAAESFADPEDAAAFIDASKYLSNGEPDTDAIRDALAELLERKPHLAKPVVVAAPTPRPPQPNPAQHAQPPRPPSAAEQGLAKAREMFGDRVPAPAGSTAASSTQ